MAADKAQTLGMKPMARILAVASSGCDPTIMGIGPVECTRIALERAKINLRDVDVIELNEAFAAQSLAVVRDWMASGVDREALLAKLNPNGGAIAMGHPLGCTGAALTVKCLYELQRVTAHRYGLITMCCAGGLGVAMIIGKGE
jgi:acetyl-CoA C-acetyltransferase